MLERFGVFANRVKAILEQKAHSKGYSVSKEDQGKELFKFVGEHFGGHPLGEIVYKCIRYRYKGYPIDLEKIAAWAYLVWQEAEAGGPTRVPAGSCVELPWPPSEPTTGAGATLTDFGERLAAEQGQRVRDFIEKDNKRKQASLIEAVACDVVKMAHEGSAKRPRVWEADPVRLAALVAEESGEAVKGALDMTRTVSPVDYSQYYLGKLREELLQTASMAIIAAAVIKSREK